MTPAILFVALLLAGCRGEVSEVPDTAPVDSEAFTGLQPTDDPGPPSFPETISTVSIAVRTGADAWDGTNTNKLSVCLTETDCYLMDIDDVDDFRRGEIDVYHFEGDDLARASVDRVEVRSVDGSDAWTMDCLQVNFDGEPVYCRDDIGVSFGNEDEEEVGSWTDPDGVASHCNTCDVSPLTHGPVVGHADPETAKVWIRTDATRSVGLRLAETQAALNDAPVYAWAYPTPDTDFTAELQAQGALAGTTYHYAVQIDGTDVHTGTLRTAPAVGTPGKTTIAYGSCSKDDDQPIFDHIAATSPDLMFFIGDNHYGNTNDLASLRWYYRWAHSRAIRSTLMSTATTLATWDDHDFVGNNTDGYDAGRKEALRAFSEYWPNPSYGTESVPGVYFSTSWGDVDLFFVDDRYWREWDDSLLGNEQTEWLIQQLSSSTASFKIVSCGSQWTTKGSGDSWAAFPSKRDELLNDLFDAGVEGLVLLSGDIHRSEFRKIAAPTTGKGYTVPELTSSPLATWNSGCQSDDEVVTCFDSGPSFVTLEVDTTLKDPTLTATLFDAQGAKQHEWPIKKSDLSLD
jgi:alkaline phosphatase D